LTAKKKRVILTSMLQLPMFQPPTWSVSEINRYLKELIEEDENLQDIWVQGEVSNLSRPPSGHIYFTLKDGGGTLACVMWKNSAMRLAKMMREGEAVEAHGSLGVYEAGGKYQLYADTVRPAGIGALYQEFLRLQARLEAEGLFDPRRKRPIPRWPQRIGIVTSPTGAAIQDMLKTLKRRYPLAQVIIAPTPVQGEEAPPGIIAALQALNDLVQPDVILLGRGGGSIEDLWAFNDEGVARAIAASKAPVICGVGHETDFTIADFVCDLRAPTPTAAAELATPNREDLLADLAELKARLGRAAQATFAGLRWQLGRLENRLSLRSPAARVRSDRQWVDELARRLLAASLHRLELRRANLAGLEQRIMALSPQAVLGRGYAMLTTPEGSVITQIAQVQTGNRLRAHVSDGQFEVVVDTHRLAEGAQGSGAEQDG
jgi:exodeoxyribonuclease VII large subunit